MPSEKNAKSAAPSPRSQPTKPPPSSASEMLTPSEVQSLRQEAIENSAYYQKAFAHTKPKAQDPFGSS